MAHSHFHTRFDAQVFGDAPHNHAQVARRGVAATVQHPVQRLFAQASLPRQFLESDLGVNQVAEHGKPLGSFAFKGMGRIIGGLGNISGAALAAVLLGVLESLMSGFLPLVLVDALAFVAMIAILLFRPQGLFGRGVRV